MVTLESLWQLQIGLRHVPSALKSLAQGMPSGTCRKAPADSALPNPLDWSLGPAAATRSGNSPAAVPMPSATQHKHVSRSRAIDAVSVFN